MSGATAVPSERPQQREYDDASQQCLPQVALREVQDGHDDEEAVHDERRDVLQDRHTREEQEHRHDGQHRAERLCDQLDSFYPLRSLRLLLLLRLLLPRSTSARPRVVEPHATHGSAAHRAGGEVEHARTAAPEAEGVHAGTHAARVEGGARGHPTEEGGEEIFWRDIRAAAPAAAPQALDSALVVDLPLLAITQDAEGLTDLFECLLGASFAALVGVQFQGELPVRFLNVVLAGVPVHTQNLVVVIARGLHTFDLIARHRPQQC
mmetsp:Transcript_28006/g.80433  ORF Transcript_28006/g.80433 Transcript_28006/m.80433 type:complete len:265 (+) Transcript_28006:157-951(+)